MNVLSKLHEWLSYLTLRSERFRPSLQSLASTRGYSRIQASAIWNLVHSSSVMNRWGSDNECRSVSLYGNRDALDLCGLCSVHVRSCAQLKKSRCQAMCAPKRNRHTFHKCSAPKSATYESLFEQRQQHAIRHRDNPRTKIRRIRIPFRECSKRIAMALVRMMK